MGKIELCNKELYLYGTKQGLSNFFAVRGHNVREDLWLL